MYHCGFLFLNLLVVFFNHWKSTNWENCTYKFDLIFSIFCTVSRCKSSSNLYQCFSPVGEAKKRFFWQCQKLSRLKKSPGVGTRSNVDFEFQPLTYRPFHLISLSHKIEIWSWVALFWLSTYLPSTHIDRVYRVDASERKGCPRSKLWKIGLVRGDRRPASTCPVLLSSWLNRLTFLSLKDIEKESEADWFFKLSILKASFSLWNYFSGALTFLWADIK